MLVLSSSLSLPVTASFLTGDPVAVQGPVAGQVLFRLAIGPTVAVFLLLAMADHFLVAAPGIHHWYERALEKRANYARWIEYSISQLPGLNRLCPEDLPGLRPDRHPEPWVPQLWSAIADEFAV